MKTLVDNKTVEVIQSPTHKELWVDGVLFAEEKLREPAVHVSIKEMMLDDDDGSYIHWFEDSDPLESLIYVLLVQSEDRDGGDVDYIPCESLAHAEQLLKEFEHPMPCKEIPTSFMYESDKRNVHWLVNNPRRVKPCLDLRMVGSYLIYGGTTESVGIRL